MIKSLKQYTGLLLLVLLFVTVLGGCGDDDPTTYDIKYIQDRESEFYGKISGLPHTDTIEEGKSYKLKKSFTGTTNTNLVYTVWHGNSHSQWYLSALSGGWHVFDPGYEITVNKSLTIYVHYRNKFKPELRVYYTLDSKDIESTQLRGFLGYSTSSFSVKAQYMTSKDGIQYKVTEWVDDNGKIYAENSSFSTSDYPNRKALVLYSNKKEAVTSNLMFVTYYGNNNTSGNVPERTLFVPGNSFTLSGNDGRLGKTGYKFVGWNTEPNGTGTDYTAGQTVTFSAGVRLYAKWERRILVNYDKNGLDVTGTAPAGGFQTGTTMIIPGNTGSMAKTGYTFGGWNTRKDGSGTTYAEGSTMLLLCNTTLYAKWDSNTVPGNGIKIIPSNTISSVTVDATHKLYWFVTTDQYCYNSGAVVQSGSVDSVASPIEVDLPPGTYYVWGFIDADGSGDRSAGDPGTLTFKTFSGFYMGDFYSMLHHLKDMVFDIAVTSSSGYTDAPLKFKESGGGIDFTFPAQYAVVTSSYNYTGSSVTVGESNELNFVVLKGGTDFNDSSYWLGGYHLSSQQSQSEFVVRLELNQAHYFGAYVDSNGDGDDDGVFPESGDPAMKYSGRHWSEAPDAFTPTEEKVYGVVLEFDDSCVVP